MVGVVACGPEGFDPASKVSSVRVLGARLDKPSPAPGDDVNIELLVHRGPDGGPQAEVYWLPIVCTNPPRDLYFACFAQLAGEAVPGAGVPILVLPNDGGSFPLDQPPACASGGGLTFEAGTDLTPFLQTGDRFSFRLPRDIIEKHPPTPGAPQPYGLAFAFNIACTGRVRVGDRNDGGTGQSTPIGCFSESGEPVGPEGYVFGFTRVYVYDDAGSTNPVIEGVSIDGVPVDVDAGLTLPRCTTEDTAACPKYALRVAVPPSSQEPYPDVDGGTRKEQVWAAYYATDGRFNGDIRVLYDPEKGALDNTQNDYQASKTAGEGTMWIVVRDDRAGTSWVQFPVRVQ